MCEAFYNVFDNAVKYSKNNSTINITMKQTEMFYKIQVRDYGIGIRDGEENNRSESCGIDSSYAACKKFVRGTMYNRLWLS